jgi:hypothetical protein
MIVWGVSPPFPIFTIMAENKPFIILSNLNIAE